MINKTEEKITLHKLHKNRRIWWIRSLPTFKKWIERDLKGKNLLKTIIINTEKTKRYYFKSSNIEKYIRAFEKRNQ